LTRYEFRVEKMDEARLQELEQRLAQAEAHIDRLTRLALPPAREGTTLVAPVRVTDASDRVLIELLGDADGGFIHLRDPDGNLRVTMGCGPGGGWLDIIHAGDERLAVTLMAAEGGGSIEITREDGCYLVQGERYYPDEQKAE
jgi:hypothetical protein